MSSQDEVGAFANVLGVSSTAIVALVHAGGSSSAGFIESDSLSKFTRNLSLASGVHINHDLSADDAAQWDGKQIAAKGRETWIVLHEICHFLIVPLERIALPNFGLGPFGDSNEALRPEQLATNMECDQEEAAACLLTLAILARLGLQDALRDSYELLFSFPYSEEDVAMTLQCTEADVRRLRTRRPGALEAVELAIEQVLALN